MRFPHALGFTVALVIALPAAVGPAVADDMPHRKPGLWEIVTQRSSAASSRISQSVCLDQETGALLDQLGIGAAQQMCSKTEAHSSGSQITINAECRVGTSQMTSESVTTFTGDAAYETKVHASFNPPFAGRASSDSVQDGKWVGPCPTDMRPGDMIMKMGGAHPHEIRTNLQEMLTPRN